jgi:hypothetical protein
MRSLLLVESFDLRLSQQYNLVDWWFEKDSKRSACGLIVVLSLHLSGGAGYKKRFKIANVSDKIRASNLVEVLPLRWPVSYPSFNYFKYRFVCVCFLSCAQVCEEVLKELSDSLNLFWCVLYSFLIEGYA